MMARWAKMVEWGHLLLPIHLIMFSRLMPQEGKFFDLFDAHAEQMVQGSRALLNMLNAFNRSGEEAVTQCGLVDEAEGRGDEIKNETISQLHKSFITPLDREEIHQLCTGFDGILDLIQDIAHTISVYDVRHITDDAIRLSELIVGCTEYLKQMVFLLRSMDNAREILDLHNKVDALEYEADQIMRKAISHLFRDEPDVRELIKFKAVYELLELVTDRCEEVAIVIEGIVLENS